MRTGWKWRITGRKKNERHTQISNNQLPYFPQREGGNRSKDFSERNVKKDYFVRSCIYNRVCVVGREELIYQLVEELKIMQTNIREVTEQFKQAEVTLSAEGLQDMRNECLDMLKAILWMLDGARYLWQDEEKSPDSGNC